MSRIFYSNYETKYTLLRLSVILRNPHYCVKMPSQRLREEILTFVLHKNPTFEGLLSLIFPVSFRLAIFKILFWVFCNLQPPLSKNRFEWHE